MQLTRITFDPEVMGGKPCLRGMRVTVGTVVGLLAAGYSEEATLQLYHILSWLICVKPCRLQLGAPKKLNRRWQIEKR
jgi:hypothetical protein